MSLTSQVKEQICALTFKPCCKKAFLSAVVHTCASLNFTSEGLSVVIGCEGAQSIKPLYDCVYPFGSSVENAKLVFCNMASEVLVDLQIFCVKNGKTAINEGICTGLIKSDCCKRAYLAGAFFGCGQLAVEGGYNLEFITASRALSLDLCGLLQHFSVRSLNGKKNGHFRAYVKDKDGICDALAAIGASKAVLDINSLIAIRDMRRETARRANCDLYNVNKSIASAVEQIKAIKNLQLNDEKLKAVAKARIDYPEASYDELKDILGVSKSTVKYRLNKIVQLYNGGKT